MQGIVKSSKSNVLRSTSKHQLLWLVCFSALLALGWSSQAMAQGQCESPNLLIVLDQSCSMGFTTGSYVRTSKVCSSVSQCTPMTRTYQPTPGTTPRYTRVCTSSRCEYTRWDVAQNAIKEIVYRYGGTAAQSYNDRVIRFGLEYFSSGATISAPIVSNPPTISTSLTNNAASGGTQYGIAFSTARSHLLATVNADPVKRRPTHILFITDGDPSDGCTSATNIARDLFLGTGANRLQDNAGNVYNVKTYVIGFGSGLSANGQACLNTIAAAGGTQRCDPNVAGCVAYFRADNDTELNNAMTSIVNNATQEVCDGLDNDCDGQTDESLTRPCTNACGTGVETCSAGNWGTCSVPPPSTERCDGIDNDCDGQVDENFPTKGQPCSAGTGACRRTGTFVCRPDQTGVQCSVTAGAPVPELCDGIDNDCDGQIDENFSTKGNACTVGQGLCQRSGTLVCTANGSGLQCSVSAGTPVAELCDGLDNDCDGQVDENWPTKGNACTVGQGICQRTGILVCTGNGSGLQCSATAGTPQPEQCDGIDNDCDGVTDEGCQCINGQTRACFSGNQGCTQSGTSYNCTAPCKSGTQLCVLGQWAACTGEVTPTAEQCDGLDNDCDGQVDETWANIGQNCSVGVGECRRTGQWRCRANKTGVECSATAGAPKTETCNNKDDNCDGQIDEGVTRNCSTPCESGTETCNAGQWVNCTARKPVAEICDGLDNDCDGSIDETWANIGQNCSVGVGECKNTGKWRCKNDNTGVECSATPGPPAKELCDGKDNDCDGSIDEDFPTLGDPCKAGVGACETSGKIECKKDASGTQCSAIAGPPQPEICNGIDDSCDGNIDGMKRPCKTACGNGSETCTNGTWGTCDAPTPKPEECNNLDDDCDGQVDGHKQKCTSKCGEGQETCVAGKWVFCDAQQPAKEICDGIDNDCNGQIDELDPKPCAAACGKGTAVCTNGQWTGCSGPSPQPEVCDGKDNDCNGLIDDGLVRICKGKCGEGRELCQNGQWLECNAPTGDPEICDGKDNDCDGIADNGAKCPVGTDCIEGQCRLKCRNGECPGGALCTNDLCEGDLCKNIKCPAESVCLAGRCTAPCDLITCPAGTVCDAGKCVKDDCYRNGCPGKQRCVRGVCEADPCLDTTCGSGQFCRDGVCIDSCAEVTCPTGERCIDGKCKPDPTQTGPCKDVKCAAGERCEEGKCVGDPCKDVNCPKGRRCIEGVCDHDPCNNIKCPSGQKCEEGQCIKDPNGNSENGNGESNSEKTNPAEGDQPDGGAGKDNSGNSDNPGNNDNNGNSDNPSNNDNSTTNTEQNNGESKTIGNNNDQLDPDGQRYVPGCGCSQNQGTIPLTPFLLFMFVAFTLWYRRKKA